MHFCKEVAKNSQAQQGPQKQSDQQLRSWLTGSEGAIMWNMNSAPLESHKAVVLLWAHLDSNYRESVDGTYKAKLNSGPFTCLLSLPTAVYQISPK